MLRDLQQQARTIDYLELHVHHCSSSSTLFVAYQISQCVKLSQLVLFYSSTPAFIQSLVSSLLSSACT